MHERPAARRQSTLHDECIPRGEEHLGDRRRVRRGDRFGDRQRLTAVRDDPLGVAAARLDAHHAIADRPVLHLGADAGDGACVLHARDLDGVTTGVGIEAHPLEDVGTVQRRVFDRHEDLVGAGHGLGDILDRQDFRATM